MSREHRAAYASRKSPANHTSDEDGNVLFMRQQAGALAAVRCVHCFSIAGFIETFQLHGLPVVKDITAERRGRPWIHTMAAGRHSREEGGAKAPAQRRPAANR